MFRHPAGVLILVFAMLFLATGLGGAITGEWGLDHVRGRMLMPGIAIALILLTVAGPRRGVVAVIAEAAAVLSVLLALNYARLIHKWAGDGVPIEQAFAAALSTGFLVAAVLFWRSRPAAEEGDWHRGSAIFGAMLWMAGLRSGPGSRAGLGLALVVLSASLVVGMFEKVQRAEALGRTAYQRWIAAPAPATPTSPFRAPGPSTSPASSPAASSWGTPTRPTAASSEEDEDQTDAAPASSDRPDAERRSHPGWGGGAPKPSAGTPPPAAGRGWINPVPERRLSPGAHGPHIREAATPVRTRITPGGSDRMGPWSGVLTDRPLTRAVDAVPGRTPTPPDRPSLVASPAAIPAGPRTPATAGPTPPPGPTPPGASTSTTWSPDPFPGPLDLLTMGPVPPETVASGEPNLTGPAPASPATAPVTDGRRDVIATPRRTAAPDVAAAWSRTVGSAASVSAQEATARRAPSPMPSSAVTPAVTSAPGPGPAMTAERPTPPAAPTAPATTTDAEFLEASPGPRPWATRPATAPSSEPTITRTAPRAAGESPPARTRSWGRSATPSAPAAPAAPTARSDSPDTEATVSAAGTRDAGPPPARSGAWGRARGSAALPSARSTGPSTEPPTVRPTEKDAAVPDAPRASWAMRPAPSVPASPSSSAASATAAPVRLPAVAPAPRRTPAPTAPPARRAGAWASPASAAAAAPASAPPPVPAPAPAAAAAPVSVRPPATGPTSWADPSFAVAADAGAMRAGTYSAPPILLAAAAGLVVGLIVIRRLTAGRRNAGPDVTATTGSP
jgi:hypothetical protein